jgi:antitoxin PrlF
MEVPATITSKGRVTLPKSVREALGLREGDRVLFRVLEGRAVLTKVADFLDLAGSVPVPRKRAAWSEIKAARGERVRPSADDEALLNTSAVIGHPATRGRWRGV